jgi:hypothetical protein
MPAAGPSVKIVAVGGKAAPADPHAALGVEGADTVVPDVSSTRVEVETANVEANSTVIVRTTPRANGSFTETAAAPIQTNSTSPLVLRWAANVPVNPGYSAFQVKVIRP